MVMPTMSAEQTANLAKIQELTKHISARVHKSENGGIEITFITESEEARAILPQIQESLVSSVANVLHLMFAIPGRVE